MRHFHPPEPRRSPPMWRGDMAVFLLLLILIACATLLLHIAIRAAFDHPRLLLAGAVAATWLVTIGLTRYRRARLSGFKPYPYRFDPHNRPSVGHRPAWEPKFDRRVLDQWVMSLALALTLVWVGVCCLSYAGLITRGDEPLVMAVSLPFAVFVIARNRHLDRL